MNTRNVDSVSVDSDGGPCDIQTIKESSRLIFFVSKFFGYSLFKLPNVNLKNHKICRKFTIKTTFVDLAILITVVLVYFFLIYYNVVLNFGFSMTDSLILSVGGQVCLIIGLAVSTAAIILCYIRRASVFKIFINLCYIDIWLQKLYDNLVVVPFNKRTEKKMRNVDTVDKIPRILDHKNHFTFSIVFLVVGLIFIVFDMVATYLMVSLEFSTNPLVFISYALQNTSFLMITAQTVLFLLIIKTRYAALNKLICCYLTIQDDCNNPNVEDLYDLETFPDNEVVYTATKSVFQRDGFYFDRKLIAEFAQTHDKLNDIIELINCCYAVQCLGVVAVSFGYVILTFFSLYYAMYHPDERTTKMAAIYLVWFIFYVCCVKTLIIASWLATTEGNKTGVLLHKSINQIMIDPHLDDVQCNEIVDSLRIFSLQLQKRSPIVSCGLFTYDWTLLFSIISASATYLIILIQFDSSMVTLTCDTNKTGNGSVE